MNDNEFKEFVVKHLIQLTEGQEKLSKDLARIGVTHGEKLSALFDGYELLKETLDDHTARLERIEAKVENHDIIIQHIRR